MSEEDHAAAVAEDYRDALDGLTMNSRVEISSLTLIARENTESAHAIAEVLVDHIKQVQPPRKLPALYLLDSIVKNVGTPYTLFFGRKLYQAFMEAYASVDNPTRRKMDEMLKTWKEPVPGSLDTRPVFPPDVVRPIENALIKARTSAIHAQQEQLRSQQHMMAGGRGRPPPGLPPGMPMPPQQPYRNTPTPPAGRGTNLHAAYAPPLNGAPGMVPEMPPHPQYPPHHNAQGMPILPHHTAPQPPPSAPASLPYIPPVAAAPPARDTITSESLTSDVTQLVTATRAEMARNPYDATLHAKLKALMDLQMLLQSASLPRDQLVLVKAQIDDLSVKFRAAATFTPTPPVAAPIPPPASAPPGPVSLDALLGKGALSALLARTTPQQQQPAFTTPPPAPVVHVPPPAMSHAAGPAPAPSPLELMAMLRKSGILPALPPPVVAPTPVSLGQSLPGIISPTGAGIPGEGMGDIALNPKSLKQPRMYLVATLHEDLGKPCTQCGRRFRNDERGRVAKTAHMDWHFSTHQRMAEAEKKGQHRSYYVDEKDWVSSRETVDVVFAAAAEEESGAAREEQGRRASGGKRWIPVPDPGSTNTVCPICQEKFEMKWMDEAQEWVWTDATRVGDRVYHASCHSEVTGEEGSGGGAGQRTGGILGKRKAEDDLVSGKIKMDPGRVSYDELPY